MKANELMIGDWVQGFLPDTNSQIVGIINEYRVAIMGGGAYMEISNEDIQPIPLTPEILEKNGFEDMGYFGKCEIENWKVICDTRNVAVVYKDHSLIEMPIMYVHQLQHALRLCGIEKEIIL